jgi:hypothetical protein
MSTVRSDLETTNFFVKNSKVKKELDIDAAVYDVRPKRSIEESERPCARRSRASRGQISEKNFET